MEQPDTSDNPDLMVALCQRIEEQARESAKPRRTEEHLRRSERRLQGILDNATVIVYFKDAEGRYILVNRRFEEFSNCNRARVIGTTDHELFPVEVAEQFRANDRQVLSLRTPQEFEEQVPQPDGVRVLLSNKFPLRDPVSGLVGVCGISTDITERKRLDEKLRETQKLESMGVLAGGIAHDFNNLLAGIMGNASVALELLSPDAQARPFLEDVVHASERAAHLTRQMLAYASKERFLAEPLNLSELVREISGLVRASIAKKVELRLQLAPNLPLVMADPGQLHQLVMNLVINGAEAIGEDGAGIVLVSTTVRELDEGYIQANFSKEEIAPGTYVLLDVTDTGTGMDQTTLARIFEPFFTTKFAGRGLGLAAAQSIVRGHKGSIRVRSAPSHGTTFEVLVPTMAQPVQVSELIEHERDPHGSGTVLLVDDEQIIRRMTRQMLERYGYSVLVADNGAQALDIFQKHAADISLVLLDLTMPVMGGAETFQQMRKILRNVPVILSSGYNEMEAVRRFADPGVAGFIHKPYTAAGLADKVKEILEAPSRDKPSGH